MQQFTVPQFIEVENKIIGPVTTLQFVILLTVGIVIFILYKILAFTYFAIFALLLFGGGVVLAFLRVNGQPFHFFLLNILETWRRPALKVWDKEHSDAELRSHLKTPKIPVPIAKPRKEPLTSSRLTEIALIVDTGGVYSAEES